MAGSAERVVGRSHVAGHYSSLRGRVCEGPLRHAGLGLHPLPRTVPILLLSWRGERLDMSGVTVQEGPREAAVVVSPPRLAFPGKR